MSIPCHGAESRIKNPSILICIKTFCQRRKQCNYNAMSHSSPVSSSVGSHAANNLSQEKIKDHWLPKLWPDPQVFSRETPQRGSSSFFFRLWLHWIRLPGGTCLSESEPAFTKQVDRPAWAKCKIITTGPLTFVNLLWLRLSTYCQ